VWRDGREQTLAATTGKMPQSEQMAAAPSGNQPNGSYHSSALDAQLAALTPQLRERYGLDETADGVVVFDIKEGSVFEQSLRSGDVIRKVAGETVTEPQQVERLVDRAKTDSRKAVLMLISRNGQDLFLGVKLGVA
jgi:serine protease Do